MENETTINDSEAKLHEAMLALEKAKSAACQAMDAADKTHADFMDLYAKHLELELKFEARRWKWQSAFMLGLLVSSLTFISINLLVDRFRDHTPQQDAVERLLEAAKTAQEALR